MNEVLEQRRKLLRETMAQSIKHERKKAGFTQAQVAEYIQLPVIAISRIERGLVSPSAECIFMLRDLFKCRLMNLFNVHRLETDLATRIEQQLEALTEEKRKIVVNMVKEMAELLKD